MRPTLRLAAGLAAATVAAWVAVCAAERRDDPPSALSDQAADLVDEFLAAHNAVRTKAGVLSLRWSPELAELAQDRATQLAATCVLDHGGLPDGLGENLLRAMPSPTAAPTPGDYVLAPSRVVGAWAAEAADFDAEVNRCAPGRQCGHFTQLVWGTTEEVGCGRARCASPAEVWVCDYRPGGNIARMRPY
jgi:pathogenesis-related protein 1